MIGVVIGLLAAPAWVPRARAADALDLSGTWYVLVHYRDTATANPDAPRWEDRVWVFERRDEGVFWTDYPIVVFRDETGRFEQLGTNRAARVLAAWEPNEDQRANIAEGLAVNPRGAKSKRLSGSDLEGWRSAGSPRARSAFSLGYHETWSIEGLPDAPVFAREDSLGSGRTEGEGGFSGRTEYRTTAIASDGASLRGSYARDGHRVGVFRMQRAGAVVNVGTTVAPEQRLREHLSGQLGVPIGEDEPDADDPR